MVKEVPTLVKVIAVLNYIGAVLMLLFGILFLVASAYLGTIFAAFLGGLAFLGSAVFIIAAVIFIALAVLFFFIGRGLWKGKQWARVVEIVLMALSVLSAIIGMVQGDIGGNIFSLVLALLIGGYLWFNGSVKQAFA